MGRTLAPRPRGPPLGRGLARPLRLLRARHSGGQVPDHVRLADVLDARKLGDAVPGQRRVRQLVPTGVVERLEGALERAAQLTLGLEQRAEGVTLGIAQLDGPHGKASYGKGLADRT